MRKLPRDTDFMTLKPAPAIAWETDSEDRIVLLVPRFKGVLLGGLWQSLTPAARRNVRVPLEARGSLLWRRMDGSTTVARMCEDLADTRPEDAEDLPQRVSMYLYRLYEQGFIEFR